MMNLTPTERYVLEVVRDRLGKIEWGTLVIEITVQNHKVEVVGDSLKRTKKFDKIQATK